MQDNMNGNNIHIKGIPEGEEEEQGIKKLFEKNQDGGVGRHTAPPHKPELTENQTTRKSDTKQIKKETFIQSSRRGGDRQPGRRGLALLWRDQDWRSVG